jgi:hypothetical protein
VLARRRSGGGRVGAASYCSVAGAYCTGRSREEASSPSPVSIDAERNRPKISRVVLRWSRGTGILCADAGSRLCSAGAGRGFWSGRGASSIDVYKL